MAGDGRTRADDAATVIDVGRPTDRRVGLYIIGQSAGLALICREPSFRPHPITNRVGGPVC